MILFTFRTTTDLGVVRVGMERARRITIVNNELAIQILKSLVNKSDKQSLFFIAEGNFYCCFHQDLLLNIVVVESGLGKFNFTTFASLSTIRFLWVLMLRMAMLIAKRGISSISALNSDFKLQLKRGLLLSIAAAFLAMQIFLHRVEWMTINKLLKPKLGRSSISNTE